MKAPFVSAGLRDVAEFSADAGRPGGRDRSSFSHSSCGAPCRRLSGHKSQQTDTETGTVAEPPTHCRRLAIQISAAVTPAGATVTAAKVPKI